jgi:hypothetical protein
MKQQITIAFLAVVLLSACASTLNVLDNVRDGQSEKEAMESVGATPTLIFENQKTKSILYGFIATFIDMYDSTITYYFVRLEDGVVVDKGMVGRRERDEIKVMAPDFDINRLFDNLTTSPMGPQKAEPLSFNVSHRDHRGETNGFHEIAACLLGELAKHGETFSFSVNSVLEMGFQV